MDTDTINSVRKNLLELISGILLDKPTIQTVSALHSAMHAFVEGCGGECSPKLTEGVALLGEWLNTAAENADTVLHQEHTSIFFLGTYSLGATASYYLTETHTNKGAPRDSVIEFYRKHGYVPKRVKLFDEDSLGVELLFLASLISEGDETLGTQKEFWDEHIKPWLGIFCGSLYDGCETSSFFRTFAKITEGYLETDREIMDVID